MKIKKLMAGLSAAALALSVMTVSAFAESSSEEPISATGAKDGITVDKFEDIEFAAGETATVKMNAGREGYKVDTSKAEFTIKITLAEDVEAEDLLFKFLDTADDSAVAYSALAADDYAAGETRTLVSAFDSFSEVVSMNDADDVWDGGFVTEFKFFVPCTVSIYAEGFSYTVEEQKPSEESSSVKTVDTPSAAAPEQSADKSSKPAAETVSKAANTESKAPSKSTTKNPDTGAAALAVIGTALAGAFAVAAKKKKQ